MLWIGIIIGLFAGVNIALLVLGMCLYSNEADKRKGYS